MKSTLHFPRFFSLFAVIVICGFFSTACVGERPELGEALNASLIEEQPVDSPLDPTGSEIEVEEPVERRPIRLAFGGDSSFQKLGTAWLDDPESLLLEIAPLFANADFAMVNLEAALGTSGTPVEKAFAFQAPPESLIALRAAGVHAASMANNHGMDYGEEGFSESLRVSEELWFPIIGIGNNEAEAYSPIRSDIDGTNLSVFAVNDVFDSSLEHAWTATDTQGGLASIKGDRLDRFVQLITAEKEHADVVVVYLHFGRERDVCPTERQQYVAASLSQAGADVIVGTHAHRLQGMGYLNDSFVAYGLSNFIFSAPSQDGARTGVLTVEIAPDGYISHEWKPAVIRNALPYPVIGNEREAELQYMNELFECTNLGREFSNE